jgi:hypothetical protein
VWIGLGSPRRERCGGCGKHYSEGDGIARSARWRSLDVAGNGHSPLTVRKR